MAYSAKSDSYLDSLWGVFGEQKLLSCICKTESCYIALLGILSTAAVQQLVQTSRVRTAEPLSTCYFKYELLVRILCRISAITATILWVRRSCWCASDLLVSEAEIRVMPMCRCITALARLSAERDWLCSLPDSNLSRHVIRFGATRMRHDAQHEAA